MIKYHNCDEETLVKKLVGGLSFYPQLPQIQEKYYDYMDVIDADNTIISIGTKEDPESIDSILRSVSSPLGHINESAMDILLNSLLPFKKILLSCWDSREQEKSSSQMLISALNLNPESDISVKSTEIQFYTQNPQEYPNELLGPNWFWLRKALREGVKEDLQIKKLEPEDIIDLVSLYMNWSEHKNKEINGTKIDNLLNTFETYKHHDIQIYAIYKENEIIAANGIAVYGQKAIQLMRHYVPSHIPAQKIIDDYVFREMKEKGINQFSVGNSRTQSPELIYYKSKFLPLKVRKRYNHLLHIN